MYIVFVVLSFDKSIDGVSAYKEGQNSVEKIPKITI